MPTECFSDTAPAVQAAIYRLFAQAGQVRCAYTLAHIEGGLTEDDVDHDIDRVCETVRSAWGIHLSEIDREGCILAYTHGYDAQADFVETSLQKIQN